MHERRPRLAHALTRTMQRLERWLLSLLKRHKPHGGPCHGLTDRFGISRIMLMRLHIGLDKLGRKPLHRLTMCVQTACPVMRTTTGFPADHHRGELCEAGEQRLPSQAFPEHAFPSLIHPCDMQHPLCQIDADATEMLLHWTHLLLGGM